MKCPELNIRRWDTQNNKMVCDVCNKTNCKELNGSSPDFVVLDTSHRFNNPTYWCVIELVNIRGEVRTEHHEDIDLQDFEILYGGITDNILSIDLQRMPKQIID